MNLNQKSCSILKKLIEKEDIDVIEYNTNHGTIFLIDFGIKNEFHEDVGEKIAKVCMGSLGSVKIDDNEIYVKIPKNPSIATMSCQMAGWSIKLNRINALGSGPARILAKKPSSIIERIGYYEKSDRALLILELETDVFPSVNVCRNILIETEANELYIPIFKTKSTTGLINIMARVVEMGIFRLYNLGYDINRIRYAEGKCIIPEPDDDIMFKSNDAIIYNGRVKIEANEWDPELTERAVSSSSKFYGKSFREIFEQSGCDFYNINPDIFAPAVLEVEDISSGEVYRAGKCHSLIKRRIFNHKK